MKLVKFKDGRYGIRRWWFFGWRYSDFMSNYTWRVKSKFFKDCKVEEKFARARLELMTDKGTIVKT